jgi:hypothetical protein
MTDYERHVHHNHEDTVTEVGDVDGYTLVEFTGRDIDGGYQWWSAYDADGKLVASGTGNVEDVGPEAIEEVAL